MKNKKNISILLALIVVMSVGLSCQMLKPNIESTNSDSKKASTNSETVKNGNGETKSNQTPAVSADEKNDFKLSAEEYYKPYQEFKVAKSEKARDEKYDAMKTKFPDGAAVEITGKVQRALEKSTDKKVSEDMKYSITVNAGGLFDFILCYLDEADKAEFENIKEGQVITIKANVLFYPSLKNSRLVETK